MGRRLPFFFVLSFALHAQMRGVATRHTAVDLSTIAQAVPLRVSPQPTPHPIRTFKAGPARTGGFSHSPGRVFGGGAATFTGFVGLLDDYGPSPPDTGGAVGRQDIVTMLNSQVAIASRTGAVRPGFPITLAQFWSGLGPFAKIFDPRILYDAAADRWLASASTSPGGIDASLLLAVSASGDPGGTWHQFQIALGGADQWADYPVLGFNKTWITVSANLMDNPPIGAYDRTAVYVFDRAALFGGFRASYTVFSEKSGQFTPATDLDRSSDTMYFAQAIADPAGGRIRISELSGPVGSENFRPGTAEIAAEETWSDTAATDSDFAPQLGSFYKVDTGDSRLQNCVLRQNSMWCAHTVFLPAAKPTRAAVHWFQADPSNGRLVQHGLLDDPAAASFYAYPSISVNRNNDAVIGFSRFTASDYPSAAFAFRMAADPIHTLRAPGIFKAGEAPYIAIGVNEGSNRWGDVSATMVDPVDDESFWTIQEFAAAPTDHYLGRWGTWWANVLMPCCSAAEQK